MSKITQSYLQKAYLNYNYNPLTGVVSSKKGKVYKANHNGYLYHKPKNQKKVVFHRMIMAVHSDQNIDNLDVDHINGVRDDNRLSNLRVVDRSMNRRNSSKPRNNTSGVVGVCWHKHENKWEIKMFRKTLGYSVNFFEACCIRKSAENQVGGFTSRHGSERKYKNSNDKN